MRIIFLVLVFGMLVSSCKTKDRNNKISDFSFYLAEPDLYVTMSKRAGGKFYVMFSKTDSVSALADSVDYVECQTEDQTLVIVFDPNNRNDIYFKYPYVKKTHKKYFNLAEMAPDDFNKKFYNRGVITDPDTLKSQYKELLIMPMSYRIVFQRDSAFDNQETIKEGDVYGGW